MSIQTPTRPLLSTLTPDQLQSLYDQAGFLLIRDVPAETIVALDGSQNQTLSSTSFSGYKLLPPTLHILTLSPPSPSNNPAPIPVPLAGTLFFSHPRQTFQRSFDVREGTLSPVAQEEGGEAAAVVSKEVLKGLDPTLAPYAFEGFEGWRGLFPDGIVDTKYVEKVLGKAHVRGGARWWDVDGFDIAGKDEDEPHEWEEGTFGAERARRHREERERVDKVEKDREDLLRSGLSEVVSEEIRQGKDGEENSQIRAGAEGEVREGGTGWVRCDVRKSWREGAVGEERTLFARDKSWLFWEVVKTQCHSDPTLLLTQLSLLLPLTLLLRSPTLLLKPYRRIFTLFAQSHLHLQPYPSPHPYLPASTPRRSEILFLYTQFLRLLCAQLSWLPREFFEVELPEARGWFEDGIEGLRVGLGVARIAGTSENGDEEAVWKSWEGLKKVLEEKFGWVVGELEGERMRAEVDDEDGEEDEEDRPVIVEM